MIPVDIYQVTGSDVIGQLGKYIIERTVDNGYVLNPVNPEIAGKPLLQAVYSLQQ